MFKMNFKSFKEKLKNDIVLDNAFTIFSRQMLASFVGFFNTFLLVKTIGVSGLGTITILTTYINFYIGIFSFQSYSAIIKFGSEAIENKDPLELKKYLKKAFIQDIISSLLTLIIAFVCIDITSVFFDLNYSIKKYIIFYLIVIPFNISRSVNAVFRLNNDYKSGPRIVLITTILKTVSLLIGLFYSFGLDYYIFFEIFFILLNSFCYLILGIYCLKKMDCLDFLRTKLTSDKRFTSFNIYNNLVSTLDLPTGQLTTLIINKLVGIESVGIYSVISKFGGVMNQVISSITQALFPALSKLVAQKRIDQAMNIVNRVFITLLSTGVIISFVFFITYKLWLNYFIPNTFYNGILVTIYSLFIAVTGAVSGIHLLFISLNLVKYNVPLVLVCNSLFLIALYFLISYIGIAGAIVALILQALLIAGIKYYIMIKKIKKVQ